MCRAGDTDEGGDTGKVFSKKGSFNLDAGSVVSPQKAGHTGFGRTRGRNWPLPEAGESQQDASTGTTEGAAAWEGQR